MKSINLAFVLLFVISLINSSSATIYRDFELMDGSVKSLDSTDYTEYILVDFFASWCIPCQVSMPELNIVFDNVDGKVSMISISMDINETIKDLVNYKNDFNINWDYGWDRTGKLNETYNVHYYPTTILLNKTRDVVKTWIGISNAKDILKEIDQYVEIDGKFQRDPIGYLKTNILVSSSIVILSIIIVLYLNKKRFS